MKAKELRNQVISKLWSYGKLPKNIQTLMTDNEVEFMLEIINTYVSEQLTIHSVSKSFDCEGERVVGEVGRCEKLCDYCKDMISEQ